jgi:predicted DNA-binding transcriptional regulator AlpA
MTSRERGTLAPRVALSDPARFRTGLPASGEGPKTDHIDKPPAPVASAWPNTPATQASADPLLTAAEVGRLLTIRTKAVYTLDIPRVKLSTRRYRWRLSDVLTYIERRITA